MIAIITKSSYKLDHIMIILHVYWEEKALLAPDQTATHLGVDG
jgi:hypothetical protein